MADSSMRMQRLAHLLSWRRYRACRRLFRHPASAHAWLAGLGSDPGELVLARGGPLTFPSFRRARKLWSFLLDPARDGARVRAEDGLLVFEHDGATLAVRPGSSYDFAIFTEVWLRDVYRLAQVPRPIDTIVDFGANIGLFSARAARLCRRVVALEPVTSNRRHAERNLAGASVASKVRLLPLAASGRSGERVAIYLSRDNSGAHSVLPGIASLEGDGGREEVETVSLADLFAREGIERCDLLKCDVEGAEYAIFLDAPPEALRRIQRLAVEVHASPELPADGVERLRARLEAAGFAVELGSDEVRLQGVLTQCMLYASRRGAV